MSLRHAILGILTVEAMTGYDLLEHFDISAGPFWPAGQAQIYPELRRMEDDGLLKAKVVPRGKLGKKRIYAVSAKGAKELARWASEPATYAPDRDPVRFKVLHLDLASFDSAQAYLEAHIAYYSEQLRNADLRRASVDDRSAAFLRRRLASREPDEHDAIAGYRAFALQGQIYRAQAEIAWAEDGLKLVERLRAGRSARAGDSQNGDARKRLRRPVAARRDEQLLPTAKGRPT